MPDPQTDAPPSTDGWQIPAHTAQVFAPKRHRHALVIPVINEGERIRRQLQAVAAANPAVDVVIADGGSTDGSLEPGWLVKTGPGRLSAQLRIAYAWCLKEGYEGIVTIDGNGKDGVDAISRFVVALESGQDYVQGSRYRPGGKAVNTPFDRKLAGRLIHAPVLSLAGRRWYTDTTNGFRGYSRRYLLDARVAPFRDVFQTYELLFYLTVRAGQLGYRTCEIPVTRIYPPTGKTPTKIAGLSGRLTMLGEVMRVALGRFAPG